jgi:hypothetical protein
MWTEAASLAFESFFRLLSFFSVCSLQFDDLQAVYLNQRRKAARIQETETEEESVPPRPKEAGGAPVGRARDTHGRRTGLEEFSNILSAYTKYR